MDRSIRIRSGAYINQLEAVASDENGTALDAMTEVSDIGPPLQSKSEQEEARAYFNRFDHVPANWHHYLKTGKHPPYLFEKTSFVNLFSDDTVIIFDIYRPPWKPFYTSDVFFYQWLKSFGLPILLHHLPQVFPSTLYVHNVTNQRTIFIMKHMLDTASADSFLVANLKDGRWKILRASPHLKSVLRILDNYNEINRLREGLLYQVKSLQLYRNNELYHLKFRFAPAS